LFRAGSAHGIHPSELCPLERLPGYYRPDEPAYRFTCRCSRRRSVGPAQQASVSGFRPFRESLTSGEGLVHRAPAAPLGFALLGFSCESLVRDFSRSPLTRFADPATNRRTHRRPRVSIGLRLASPVCRTEVWNPAEATLLGSMHRLGPVAFERVFFRDMCSPLTVSCIAADHPVIFGRTPSLYRSCRDRLRCRAFATSTSHG